MRTRHSTATMTMAAEEGSNPFPNRMIVAYSAAMATTAGTIACTPISIATRKLCFSNTGWVIKHPLGDDRHALRPSRATYSQHDLPTLSHQSNDLVLS